MVFRDNSFYATDPAANEYGMNGIGLTFLMNIPLRPMTLHLKRGRGEVNGEEGGGERVGQRGVGRMIEDWGCCEKLET